MYKTLAIIFSDDLVRKALANVFQPSKKRWCRHSSDQYCSIYMYSQMKRNHQQITHTCETLDLFILIFYLVICPTLFIIDEVFEESLNFVETRCFSGSLSFVLCSVHCPLWFIVSYGYIWCQQMSSFYIIDISTPNLPASCLHRYLPINTRLLAISTWQCVVHSFLWRNSLLNVDEKI